MELGVDHLPATTENGDGADAADAADGADGADAPDGRRLRRLRNREAVVDSLLDLFQQGVLNPSTDEVAEHAGLSPRSLFRYFDDVEDLTRAALARAEGRSLPLLAIHTDADDPLPRRVEALIDQRFALFGELGQAATVTRLRAPFQPLVAKSLADHRQFLRDQVRTVLAPELAAFPPEVADQRLAAADVLTSFETIRLLEEDQQLGSTRARATIAAAVVALVTAPDADADAGGSDGATGP